MTTFTCVCCKAETDDHEAHLDETYGGNVCHHCWKLGIKAAAYLKHEGITRPFSSADIDAFNCNRIKNYYK
jgi:hypothetical protein